MVDDLENYNLDGLLGLSNEFSCVFTEEWYKILFDAIWLYADDGTVKILNWSKFLIIK